MVFEKENVEKDKKNSESEEVEKGNQEIGNQ